MGASGVTLLAISVRAGCLAANFSQENLTSAAFKARPFVGGRWSKGMFGRSLRVTWVASGETSQDSAASPSWLPSALAGYLPMECLRSRLYTQIVRPPVVEALVRPSKSVGSAGAGIVLTPPRLALAGGATRPATRPAPPPPLGLLRLPP